MAYGARLGFPSAALPLLDARLRHGCRLIFAFCLLFFFSSCGRANLDKAQKAWDGGDYERAAQLYEQFLKDRPQDAKAPFALYQLATVYRRDLRQCDKAIPHYIHLVEDFPKSADATAARMSLAECYAKTGKPREAVSEYENLLPSVTDEKERRRVRLNIADLYFEMNNSGQAVVEYQKVTTGAPYDELSERAYLRIGGIRFIRDELDEAIPAYQTVESNTKDAALRRAARFGLVDAYERSFKYDQAIHMLEAMESDPKKPEYIQQRIATIREQQRQRNLTVPAGQGWPGTK